MITPSSKLTPYQPADFFRVLPLLQHPDRIFLQVDWQPWTRWLLRPDLCGVVAWQADEPIGLLVAGTPRAGTAWLRVAALSGSGMLMGGSGYASRLHGLWDELSICLRDAGARRVVVLPIDGWLRLGLAPQGFQAIDRVLEMRYAGRSMVDDPAGLDLSLRPVETADLDTLVAIDTAALAPLWRLERDDLIAALDDKARITVAVEAGRVVGFQITYLSERGVHLARLTVAPDRQGQGIGGALLDAELATYQGAAAITLNVLESSAGAQRLYMRKGFALTGEDVPLWALDLD